MWPWLNVAVVENGPLCSGDGGGNSRFPLVVFSPGNGSMRTTYSLMCSEMASRQRLFGAGEGAITCHK